LTDDRLVDCSGPLLNLASRHGSGLD
jgi:hypothetical protein